jgi:hypothetical protein
MMPMMVPKALTGLRIGALTTIHIIGPALVARTDTATFPSVANTAITIQAGGSFIASGPDSYIVGPAGSIQHSVGAMTSYVAVNSPTSTNLRDIWGASDGSLLAVGESGTTISRTQGTWQVETAVTAANLNRVWGSDPTHAWAVGEGGTILSRTVQ